MKKARGLKSGFPVFLSARCGKNPGNPTDIGTAFGSPSLNGHRGRWVAGIWYLVAGTTAATAAIDLATSHQPLATSYLATIRIAENDSQHHKAQDFLIAHAFATLTTSPEFGETSVSILTPAPYSLDKFLHLTDTGSCWCFLFCVISIFVDRGQIEIEVEIE